MDEYAMNLSDLWLSGPNGQNSKNTVYYAGGAIVNAPSSNTLDSMSQRVREDKTAAHAPHDMRLVTTTNTVTSVNQADYITWTPAIYSRDYTPWRIAPAGSRNYTGWRPEGPPGRYPRLPDRSAAPTIIPPNIISFMPITRPEDVSTPPEEAAPLPPPERDEFPGLDKKPKRRRIIPNLPDQA